MMTQHLTSTEQVRVLMHKTVSIVLVPDSILSEWTTVEKGVNIPWDLEATPLQIKTDSTLGSDKEIRMIMYVNWLNFFSVRVKFSSPMQYYMGYCTDWTTLPVQPPVEVDKIWTITKAKTALIITCNNVEVLNYLFAGSSISDCVTKFGGGDVGKIEFSSSYDTASDFYRAAPECLAFTVDGSTQGSWTASPVGTTVTIECAATHSLVGNAKLTCQEDGSCINQLIGRVINQFYLLVCPGFTVDGSVQGSWNDTDPGQAVTIKCQKKYVLDGSSERTCNSDGEWNTDAPLCRKLIIFRRFLKLHLPSAAKKGPP
eukprot:sb/3467015/